MFPAAQDGYIDKGPLWHQGPENHPGPGNQEGACRITQACLHLIFAGVEFILGHGPRPRRKIIYAVDWNRFCIYPRCQHYQVAGQLFTGYLDLRPLPEMDTGYRLIFYLRAAFLSLPDEPPVETDVGIIMGYPRAAPAVNAGNLHVFFRVGDAD